MPLEPQLKRTVAFFDGQNLFHAAREAFGYTYPNYDPAALARTICSNAGWKLTQVRFYTGIPDPGAAPLVTVPRHGVGNCVTWHPDSECEIVLRHADVDRSSQEILDRYRIPSDRSPNVRTRHAFRFSQEQHLQVCCEYHGDSLRA